MLNYSDAHETKMSTVTTFKGKPPHSFLFVWFWIYLSLLLLLLFGKCTCQVKFGVSQFLEKFFALPKTKCVNLRMHGVRLS